jgi:hypothetical protein
MVVINQSTCSKCIKKSAIGLTKQQGNPEDQHDFRYTARSSNFHPPSASTKCTSSGQDPFYPAIKSNVSNTLAKMTSLSIDE